MNKISRNFFALTSQHPEAAKLLLAMVEVGIITPNEARRVMGLKPLGSKAAENERGRP